MQFRHTAFLLALLGGGCAAETSTTELIETTPAHGKADVATPVAGLRGAVLGTFSGELDPFVVGEACITYVRVALDGDFPAGTYGLVEDFDECTSARAFTGRTGARVFASEADLFAITDADKLAVLGDYAGKPTTYFELTEPLYDYAALGARWHAVADYLNDYQDTASDHHFFVYGFGSSSAGALESDEREQVASSCRVEDPSEYVSSTELSAAQLEEALDDIAISTALASVGTEERTDHGEHFAKIDELVAVLREAASHSSAIVRVSSGGDCQGYWSNTHWVLVGDFGVFSVSLGGGE